MGMTQEEFEAKKAADAAKGVEEKHDAKTEAKDDHMAPPDELDAEQD